MHLMMYDDDDGHDSSGSRLGCVCVEEGYVDDASLAARRASRSFCCSSAANNNGRHRGATSGDGA